MVRKLLVGVGFVSLVLGIVGAVLPVVPTVPFLFVSYVCFKNGSPKFHSWYINTKFHKNYLKSVRFFKSLSLRYKILYIAGILCFFAALGTIYYFVYNNFISAFWNERHI
ncbi:MAG: YbaN family protein [Clostridia bacterium]|nr:YbaN family protein [Clostridia bacterium]